MQTGINITVIPSVALLELGLTGLAGVKGTVVEVHRNREGRTTGAWVSLMEGKLFLGEQEWFIPVESISLI